MSDNISPSLMFPNVAHSDKWSLTLSNIPTLGSIRDLRIYENYVKEFSIPDYSIGEIESHMMGFKVRHPMGGMRPNEDLGQINITFKLCEDMKNYLNLFEWVRALRYGDIGSFTDPAEFFRKNTIKYINLSILDNEKRTTAVLKFTEASLINLSGIQLNTGVSEEVTFTTTFSFEELKYEIPLRCSN